MIRRNGEHTGKSKAWHAAIEGRRKRLLRRSMIRKHRKPKSESGINDTEIRKKDGKSF